MASISDIIIYPIKGCRGYSMAAADVSTAGIAGDRVFTVLLEGERSNQKRIAGLRQLAARWQGDELVMSYPGCSDFLLDTSANLAELDEPFRGKSVPLSDMGDAVAAWLSSALALDVRLVRYRDATPFVIPLPEFALVDGKPQDRFVDAAPLLVTSTASLADLNQRLETPVSMDRFRPNIVLTDVAPYEEDSLQTLRFANATIANVTVCERCVITTMDQQSGVMNKEPLNTLSKYRKRAGGYAGGIMFGMYATATAAGNLSVGDTTR